MIAVDPDEPRRFEEPARPRLQRLLEPVTAQPPTEREESEEVEEFRTLPPEHAIVSPWKRGTRVPPPAP
jgi:hypothetical protein